MGITRDQIAEGALNRLRHHYEKMVKLDEQMKNGRGYHDRLEFDTQAWAFVRTFITSDKLRHLVQHVGWTFRYGKELEYPTWREENEPNPLWGLEILELLVRGHVLLDYYRSDYDHGSELSGAWDALEMLDGVTQADWYADALLYVEPERYVKWGGHLIDEHSWLGFPNRLKKLNEKIETRSR